MTLSSEKISGRIGSRIVGILELFLAISMLAFYFWYVLNYCWKELQECRSCVLMTALFGIYFTFGVSISAVLILSTFPVIRLDTRKWIAVTWCLFNMISFIGTVIFICVSPLIQTKVRVCQIAVNKLQDINYFMLVIAHLIKLAIFFCIVCTYVWGISEKIVDMKMYAMPVFPRRRTRRLKLEF